MTKLLEKVLSEASKLPEEEQDRWARMWLDELASEHRWDNALSSSEAVLSHLADEALAEHRAGRTEDLDPDAL